MTLGAYAMLIIFAAGIFMLLRSRRRSANVPVQPPPRASAGDPIADFWAWWETARGPLAQAIHNRTISEWTDPISERVHAIDPGLAWELGPGVKSEHHICVTSEGDALLRITAQRWLSRAPAPDEMWEYYPARQASRSDPKSTLKLDGVALDYADYRTHCEIDDVRRYVHVTMYHPKFTALSEQSRMTATFLMLDDTFGEDDVVRWIGRVTTTCESSEAEQPRAALKEAVAKLAESQKEESFTLLQDQSKDGQPLLATVNLGLKRIDHLLMDNHVAITIPYSARQDGLYEGTQGDDLNAMEDDLLEALGKDAIYLGHETGLGKRVIHLHAASAGPAAGVLERWERMYPTWDIQTEIKSDPQWTIMKKW